MQAEQCRIVLLGARKEIIFVISHALGILLSRILPSQSGPHNPSGLCMVPNLTPCPCMHLGLACQKHLLEASSCPELSKWSFRCCHHSSCDICAPWRASVTFTIIQQQAVRRLYCISILTIQHSSWITLRLSSGKDARLSQRAWTALVVRGKKGINCTWPSAMSNIVWQSIAS